MYLNKFKIIMPKIMLVLFIVILSIIIINYFQIDVNNNNGLNYL